MKLYEVGNNHRRNVRELAQDIVRTWEKPSLTQLERKWLDHLSLDDPLLAKFFRHSRKFHQYGGEQNDQLLPAAYECARAYNILAGLKQREDFDNFIAAPTTTNGVTSFGIV